MKNKIKKIIKQVSPVFIACFLLIGSFTLMSLTKKTIQKGAAWVAPKSASERINPVKDDAAATAKGKALYNQMCSACHGKKGKGDGEGGITLTPSPANFTKSEIQEQTDGAIHWKLTEGRGGMASYKKTLNEEQRWQLVNYIREFAKAVAPKK
ncbi:MAG TPA: cytochrome c [Bacteroidia bacterium]